MPGMIILGGGGNEKLSYAIDKIFFKGVKNTLYIPLAWPNDDFKSCLKWFKKLARKIGKFRIDMLTDWKQKIDLNKYDAVYVGGGNTFKLLKRIKEGGLDSKLIEFYKKGGRIFGGSAGAIIFGKDIFIALFCKDKDVNLVRLKNTKGMNIAKGFDIQCHYEGSQLKEHIGYVAKTNRNVIAIPEESGLLIKGNICKAIGLKPITVITKKAVKRYEPNEVIEI
jgi:dipeptidase E